MKHIVLNLIAKFESTAIGGEGLGGVTEAFALAMADIEVIMKTTKQSQYEGEVLRQECADPPKIEGFHAREIWCYIKPR